MGLLSIFTIVFIFYSIQVIKAQIFGEIQDAMKCVAKLLPCQPYIHFSIPPPSSCCGPMKEIVEEDEKCLCIAFNHPDLLRFIALSKESALKLLRSCEINSDLSTCNKNNPALPTTAVTSGGSSSTKKNAALTISSLGFSLYLLFLG